MILALRITVGILLVLLTIRYFLDYREFKELRKANGDLLFTLFAYQMFYGDMDESKVKMARKSFHEMLEKGLGQDE